MSDDDLLEEYSLPRYSQPNGYIDYETTALVNMETHIPESNVGYKLLQKMGWTVGKGLGPELQGRIDPIRIEVKDDSLGVGKGEEYNTTHVITTAKRKALDSEKQMEETDIQRELREYKAEQQLAIAKELQEVKRAFYCELCDKQYKKISEYEQHLQSYDHHHKKRFKDMKEATRNSTVKQTERDKKLAREKKREERELKRLQDAILKRAEANSDSKVKVEDYMMAAPAVNHGVSSSNSRGGWSSTTTSSVKMEPDDGNNKGGGWTSAPNSAVAQPVPATTFGKFNPQIKNNNIQNGSEGKASTASSPANTNVASAPSETSPPKKLSFGLKKSGFQFGLKKK